MNERKTSSILQRVPVILAVTAASYGLQLPAQAGRPGQPTTAAATSARVQPGTPVAAVTTANVQRRAS
jgi:hypothetical protein